MSPAALYSGKVVHRRIAPRAHALSYRVFSLMLDPERLSETASRLRLFSVGRFNLVSFFEADFGDGKDLMAHLRRTTDGLPEGRDVTRFQMLCYPRVLGYAFNPLTVYFGLDEAGRVRVMLYEVSNTFGQRKTYAVPVTGSDGATISQSCAKSLYVSPFNDVSGQYSFRASQPDAEELTLGVALRNGEGPCLKAYFVGTRKPLSDASLARAVLRAGFLTAKVTAAIHWEALKLWIKGLTLKPRPLHSGPAVDYASGPRARD